MPGDLTHTDERVRVSRRCLRFSTFRHPSRPKDQNIGRKRGGEILHGSKRKSGWGDV